MAIDDFSVGASQSEILQVREFRGDLGSEQEELGEYLVRGVFHVVGVHGGFFTDETFTE